MRSATVVMALPIALAAMGATTTVAGCFGATEIRVAITTTAECRAGIHTQIFTGPKGTTDFGSGSAAETRECLPEEPRIGTLSIVPSGTRDGQFDLEVVAGVGLSASECRQEALGRADPTKIDPAKGCIVARRRVSFRPHKSLEVPVLLSARCLNVACGADQTCDLGACAPAVDCTDTGCPRERGDVPVDAGPDNLVDAAPDVADASVDAPVDATPTLVVGGQRIVGQLQMEGTDFIYVNGPPAIGQAAEVKRVARDGSVESVFQSNNQITAAVAGAAGIAWACDATTVMNITRTVVPAGYTTLGSSLHGAQALAFSGTTIVGFANQPNNDLLAFSGVSGNVATEAHNPALVASVPEILVDDQGHWYGVSGPNVVHYGVGPSNNPVFQGALMNVGPKPDFALVGSTLYVALGPPSSTGIHRIAGSSIDLTGTVYQQPAWIPMAAPRSIASYGTSIYYVEGTTLFRVDSTTSSPNPTPLCTVAPTAERLVVDDTWVYWVEGTNGLRIMRLAR